MLLTALICHCFQKLNNSSGCRRPVDKCSVLKKLCTTLLKKPLNNPFGDKPDHAKSQSNEDDEGAELASFGLPCQLKNDEHHVEHEGANPYGQTEPCKLFFGEIHGVSCPCMRSGQPSTFTRSR